MILNNYYLSPEILLKEIQIKYFFIFKIQNGIRYFNIVTISSSYFNAQVGNALNTTILTGKESHLV